MPRTLLVLLLLAGLLGCAGAGPRLDRGEREALGPEASALARRAGPDDPEAGLELARRLLEIGSEAKARAWLRVLAEAGSRPAGRELGQAYLALVERQVRSVDEAGETRSPYREACRWLHWAAEDGDPAAQLQLALGWAAPGCRRPLLGIARPDTGSRSERRQDVFWRETWLRRSASQDHEPAALALAELLLEPLDEGGESLFDPPEKIQRIREGMARLIAVARQGYAPAEALLGSLYVPEQRCRRTSLPPTLACRLLRERIPEHPRRARFWLERAAGVGHSCASTALAALHASGELGRRDWGAAHRSLVRAVEAPPPSVEELPEPLATRARTEHDSCRRVATSRLQELATRRAPGLVAEAQTRLAELGYPGGEPDGIRGERTRDAVRRFQRDAGLYPDGEITFGLLDQLRRSRRLAGIPPEPGPTGRPRADTREDAAPPASPGPGPDRARSLYARRVAAVIGIDRYRRWPGLEGARRDARRVAAVLRAQGFDRVIEIYDREATRTRMLTLLGRELAAATDEDSLAVVYFAGHGETERLRQGGERGYIVPVDADPADAFATAIGMDTLRNLSERLPARHVYFAMDSCYSGLGLVRGISRRPGTPALLRELTGRRAVQMITAGSRGQRALERDGMGLFTRHFLDAIQGEADRDGDGFVTASEIGAYVRPQVYQASRQRQTPQFGSLEGGGEVVFVPARREAAR